MKKTIRDVKVTGQRVLVRADFNVPMENGQILNDARIRAVLPTIRYLVEQRARVIIMSHLGRPAGYVVEELRMNPIAERLADLLRMPVAKVNNSIGPEVHDAVQALEPGQVLMLENLRFHPGELVNDTRFAARLASFADLFVNDAFATSHRIHASTVGITRYLPAVAGLLMENELSGLRRIQLKIQKPVVILLGGIRLVDKIHFIDDHLERGSQILLGGVLANTFLHASGLETGQSRVESEMLGLARMLIYEAGSLLLLPSDVVVADGLSERVQHKVVPVERIPASHLIVDIGPETITRYKRALEDARTVIWNGPLGAVEQPDCTAGTRAIAEKISTLENTTRIAGGGETLAALDSTGHTAKLDYLSTGGSAFLVALEDDPLPGVKVLMDQMEEQEVTDEADQY